MTKTKMTEIIIPVVGLIEKDGVLVVKEDIVIMYQLIESESEK